MLFQHKCLPLPYKIAFIPVRHMETKGTYIAFDACGVLDHVNSNLRTFKQLGEWQKSFPGRFDFVNLEDINFSSTHDDLLDSTMKTEFLRKMSQADNVLVIASPVINTESPILNWQISRAVNRFHLPVIIAYAGLEEVKEDTIQQYWNWLPQKFRKYMTINSWARMAHIPLTRDKLERALKTYSRSKQQYPWDSTTIF